VTRVIDHVKVIASLGALAAAAESRGDSAAAQSLHDAIEVIVDARSLLAKAEKRR